MKKTFVLICTLVSMFSAELAYAGNHCKSAAEKKCLADTINGEARNQGIDGMIIVAKAIMTRYARGYKGSICGVTGPSSFHRNSSRPTKGGPVDVQANNNVAKAATLGCTYGDMGITHFYKMGTKKPAWASKFPKANPSQHGKHYLYNAPMYVKADFEMEDWSNLIENPVYEVPADEVQVNPGDTTISI